jgi:acyl-CoA reductase-like NAD-dependent aldehyde dehydrogenase
MAETFKNFVGGEWTDAASGKRFENRNPANWDELVGTHPDSDAGDVEKAIAAAAKAFRSWRLLPAPKRAEILFHAGTLLAQRKEELAQLMTREMG